MAITVCSPVCAIDWMCPASYVETLLLCDGIRKWSEDCEKQLGLGEFMSVEPS